MCRVARYINGYTRTETILVRYVPPFCKYCAAFAILVLIALLLRLAWRLPISTMTQCSTEGIDVYCQKQVFGTYTRIVLRRSS